MLKSVFTIAALLSASPALAQSMDSSLPDPNDQSDTLTIGAGAAYVPDYEGSDDYRIIPAAGIRGRFHGISFVSRASWLYLDFIPRGQGNLEFDLGPIVGVRFNRSSKIKDDVVDDLPDRKKAIEFGGFAGVTYHGLTNPYDALSFRVDVVKDLGDAHESTVITPAVEFGTPISRRTYIGASLSAEWAGGGYADY